MCAFCTSLHGTLESDVIFEGKDNYLISVVCQAHDLLYMLFGLLYLSISFGCMVLDARMMSLEVICHLLLEIHFWKFVISFCSIQCGSE